MDFLDQIFLGNTVLVWLIFVGIILGSIILGAITSRITKSIGKRSNSPFIKEFIPKLGRLGMAFLFLLGLRIGLSTLSLPVETLDFSSKTISFGISFIFILVALHSYETLHKIVLIPFAKRTETQVDDHLIGILRMVMRVLIIILGMLIGLSNAGFNVGAALAGLGIGGLAFALAAQDAVSNLFGGVIVLVEKPFKVGNQIEINKMRGYVRDIGLRTTVLESRFGRILRVPNKVFTSNPVELITHTKTLYRVINRIQIKYNTPADKIEIALKDLTSILQNQEAVKYKRAAFEGFGDYGYKLVFVYEILKWSPEQKEQFPRPILKADMLKTAVNLKIVRAFERENIKMAVPIQGEVQVNFDNHNKDTH